MSLTRGFFETEPWLPQCIYRREEKSGEGGIGQGYTKRSRGVSSLQKKEAYHVQADKGVQEALEYRQDKRGVRVKQVLIDGGQCDEQRRLSGDWAKYDCGAWAMSGEDRSGWSGGAAEGWQFSEKMREFQVGRGSKWVKHMFGGASWEESFLHIYMPC
jgi:hypothetical protein